MKNLKLMLLIVLCFITLTGCESSVVKEPSTVLYNKINTTSELNNNNIKQNQEKIFSPEVISNFSTKIYDTSKGRMNNLELAAKQLSNTVINSRRSFFF